MVPCPWPRQSKQNGQSQVLFDRSCGELRLPGPTKPKERQIWVTALARALRHPLVTLCLERLRPADYLEWVLSSAVVQEGSGLDGEMGSPKDGVVTQMQFDAELQSLEKMGSEALLRQLDEYVTTQALARADTVLAVLKDALRQRPEGEEKLLQSRTTRMVLAEAMKRQQPWQIPSTAISQGKADVSSVNSSAPVADTTSAADVDEVSPDKQVSPQRNMHDSEGSGEKSSIASPASEDGPTSPNTIGLRSDVPFEALNDASARNTKTSNSSEVHAGGPGLGVGRAEDSTAGAIPSHPPRARPDPPADPNPLPLFWESKGLFKGFANGRNSNPASSSQASSRGKEASPPPEQVTPVARSSSEIFKAELFTKMRGPNFEFDPIEPEEEVTACRTWSQSDSRETKRWTYTPPQRTMWA